MNRYQLIGKDGKPYESAAPGTLGGHRATRIYGRLDCPSALRALANGGYAMNRVFFADEATAVAAGYRPCARCLPEPYRDWRERANTAAPAPVKAAIGHRRKPQSSSPQPNPTANPASTMPMRFALWSCPTSGGRTSSKVLGEPAMKLAVKALAAALAFMASGYATST